MSMLDLEGAAYGPFPYRTDPEKVGEYAAAVGVDPSETTAPKSLAGALLFVVAPHLLGDDRAGDSTRSVIHGDQSFAWHRPIPLGAELAVSGKVIRVRERSGVFLTGFQMEVVDAEGIVVTGNSTFLMSGTAVTIGAGGRELEEPDPLEGSVREVRGSLAEEPSVVGHFSASRSDLVRYAGASRDWNPIHWDHAAAVAAGLPGVVVHGLLQSAWAVEGAIQLGLDPVAARFRYKRPLGAAVRVAMSVGLQGDGAVFELGDSEGLYLTGTIE
jgi:acyl dehydratase